MKALAVSSAAINLTIAGMILAGYEFSNPVIFETYVVTMIIVLCMNHLTSAFRK